MDRGNYVTAEKVKNALLGQEHRYHTLMQMFKQFDDDYKQMYEGGLKSKSSYEKYSTVYKRLQNFLYRRCHVKDITLKEFTLALIQKRLTANLIRSPPFRS